MKVLVFHIGIDRYGLRLAAIVRVLPLLELKQLPLVPDYVAGLAPAALQFDTRIVVVDYHAANGTSHALGLMASRVRGIVEIDEGKLADSGVATAPFLGQVASDADGMLQLIELEQLLSPEVRALLFRQGGAT